MRRRRPIAGIIAAAIAVIVAVFLQRGEERGAAGSQPAEVRPAPTATENGGPRDRLSTVLAADERVEVEKTLALIERGGPFPHRQDGTVFSNRERRLPMQPKGYYREYTVETPGASTRGARRIIRGAKGETYYTRDHYATFVRIG